MEDLMKFDFLTIKDLEESYPYAMEKMEELGFDQLLAELKTSIPQNEMPNFIRGVLDTCKYVLVKELIAPNEHELS